MVWRRFQEWRQRRSTLKELIRLEKAEEKALAARDLNPLYLAKLALERGDISLAAMRWKDACLQLPNVIVESRDSLGILIGLKEFDQAESLMRIGHERFPQDSYYPVALAQIAQQRGDFAEAAKRWDRVPESADKPHARIQMGICFRELRQFDKAEALFDAVIRSQPDHLVAWLERARISEILRDWPEALVRWRYLTDQFGFGAASAGEARALVELGRIEEAEARLEEALPNNPQDLEIAVTRAHLARRVGNLTVECDRWAAVRSIAPYFQHGYQSGARCLVAAGRYDEADAVLRRAVDLFAREPWPWHELVLAAQNRGDEPEAAKRWADLHERFPDDSWDSEAANG